MKKLFKLCLFALSLSLLPLAGCGTSMNVKSIKLDKTSLKVTVGDKAVPLIATITPNDSKKDYKKDFTIKSSSSVIKLKATKGVSGTAFTFDALKVGTADITVTSLEGEFSATCKVNVSEAGGGGGVLTRDVYVIYHLDYNQTDTFYSYKAKTGDLVKKPDKQVTDDMAPDSAFPHFLGWSAHPIIDDIKDLWDFDNDRIEGDERVRLYLYGIWVEK